MSAFVFLFCLKKKDFDFLRLYDPQQKTFFIHLIEFLLKKSLRIENLAGKIYINFYTNYATSTLIVFLLIGGPANELIFQGTGVFQSKGFPPSPWLELFSCKNILLDFAKYHKTISKLMLGA